MKLIKTEEAVGQVLCHDITQIIRGVKKGPVFKKGHIITPEDIPVLLSVGKENIYIWEKDENMLHENEAAMVLCEICRGENMHSSPLSEGKTELFADIDGLFRVNREKLLKLNSIGEIIISCRFGNTPVKKGDKLAGMRVIPLVIEKEKMERAKKVSSPIFEISPYILKRAAIVVTGSEVKKGLIKDDFSPVIKEKLREYGVGVDEVITAGDDGNFITGSINRLIENGAEMVLCTGGMSVDPDDRTPLAIRNTGAEAAVYGVPVLPGAMFMLAYKGDVPVMGLPGCVMYSERTVFDLVLPRIIAGERLCREDFVPLGEGGLCLSCPVCNYPRCGFGKGR